MQPMLVHSVRWWPTPVGVGRVLAAKSIKKEGRESEEGERKGKSKAKAKAKQSK